VNTLLRTGFPTLLAEEELAVDSTRWHYSPGESPANYMPIKSPYSLRCFRSHFSGEMLHSFCDTEFNILKQMMTNSQEKALSSGTNFHQ